MQWGLIFVLAIFGVAYVYSKECICPKVSQRKVYDASDLVAKVRFQDIQPDSNNNFLVFNTTFVNLFKPNNSTKPINGIVQADLNLTECNPIQHLMLNEDYLIGVKKIDGNYQFVSCQGFPQHSFGRPIIAQPWDLVTNKTMAALRTGKFAKDLSI